MNLDGESLARHIERVHGRDRHGRHKQWENAPLPELSLAFQRGNSQDYLRRIRLRIRFSRIRARRLISRNSCVRVMPAAALRLGATAAACLLGTRLSSFDLCRSNHEARRCHSVSLRPGDLLGIREAAALPPTLFGCAAAAGTVLAGERLRCVFFQVWRAW